MDQKRHSQRSYLARSWRMGEGEALPAQGTTNAWDRPKKYMATWGKNDQYNEAAT